MKREILERPFDPQLIKTRRGHSGKTFSYIEGADYIRRLNEAFDGQWSFEVVEHQVREREVIVLGRIVAEGCTKSAFGGSSITASSQTGEPLALADDLKAAATDALKKAASLFGIGLHLYSPELSHPEDERDEAAPPSPPPPQRKVVKGEPQATREVHQERGQGGKAAGAERDEGEKAVRTAPKAAPAGAKVGGSTLTERQLNAIMAIGRTLGWTSEALRQRSIDVYGVPPNELTKADASAFIGELQQIATKSAA